MFSLKGKTALITGSGRGIGLAIAEAMAQQGADIFLSDINGAVVEAGHRHNIPVPTHEFVVELVHAMEGRA